MASPDDLRNPGTLLRAAAPSTKHARALLDVLVDRLGERARVVAAGGGRRRQVHVAVDDGILPWPLANLSVTDPAVLDADEAERPPAEPWKDSASARPDGFIELTFHPVPANLDVWDGPTRLTVNYDRDGKVADAVGPLDATMYASLAAALGAGTDSRLELLAAWLVGLPTGRHGPARVLVPRPMPAGPAGVWVAARGAVRRALAEGRAPSAACWAVADGVAGTALAFGPTRAAALASWRQAVARVRPAPPAPPARPESGTTFEPTAWRPDDEGHATEFFARGAAWDAPPFDGSPEALPAGVVPLDAARLEDTSPGEPVRLLGEHGTTEHARRIPRGDGYLLVGEALAGRVDLADLDAPRRRARRDMPGAEMRRMLTARTGVELTTSVLWFRCLDERTGAPCPPRVTQSGQVGAFDVAGFDGASLRHSIVEVAPLP